MRVTPTVVAERRSAKLGGRRRMSDESTERFSDEQARSILARLTPESAARIRAYLLRQLSK